MQADILTTEPYLQPLFGEMFLFFLEDLYYSSSWPRTRYIAQDGLNLPLPHFPEC